jgi:hypothetical protein
MEAAFHRGDVAPLVRPTTQFQELSMTSFSMKKLATTALAVAALASASSAFAAKPIDAYYHATNGSLDYRFMGYTDADGNYVSLAGQTILGARAEVQFTPDEEADLANFRMAMVVPVDGAQSQYFLVDGTSLIPTGTKGKYYADLTSALYNGTIIESRFSIETYTLDANGNPVSLHGALGTKSGFHFVVTHP